MALAQKLLIANRGEIACRIARTARRLNIRTVAVFSDADAGARHVAACDEAIRIGPAAPRESYLCVAAILEAARQTGADTVHPGYGFLSENASFAEACIRAGLVFVGPPPSAIRLMGSKSAAKSLMGRAGVPLTPGYHGDRQDPEFLEAEAGRIGYPILIKASAGGGGKGMRRVDRREDFAAALAACKRESASSFGDDRVLIERYVLRPRHIEIQVFADQHGHTLHLFERDCSVQRRHQKVLEEAPAPGMTPARRTAMGNAAVAAAKAVDYVGAGTVEFIVDPDGVFYFMEMNTRLQVEHPVTEMITGLDLVEWQLRVAAGEPLPLVPEQLAIKGHSFEARVYAEDPERGFLPSIGRLEYVSMPCESRNVRIDAGIGTGDEITPYYDAMIAKLIVWDETRERALRRLQSTLAQCLFAGVTTNVAFLRRLAGSSLLQAGEQDTDLIEREHQRLFPPHVVPPREAWLDAASALLARESGRDRDNECDRGPQGAWHERVSPWCTRNGWRIGARQERALTLRVAEDARSIRVRYLPVGWELELEGTATPALATFRDATTLSLRLGATERLARVAVWGNCEHVQFAGETRVFTVVNPYLPPRSAAVDSGHLRSPMPGRVVTLLVEEGSRVAKGTPLLVLEAMKMEHTIVAPFAGLLRSFKVKTGDQVPEGVELVELTPATDSP